MQLVIPAGLPWDDGRWACSILLEAGHEAWFVGGCVRDLILLREVHDVDIATSAHPEDVIACFPNVIEVGRSFGVILAVHPSGRHLEIATFRHDGAYIDGRRPASIVYSSASDDVRRRDFTINGLLLDPRNGLVVDYVDGLPDIEHRCLRVIESPLRLAEDRLRVLRGLRFMAHLELTATSDTWAALCATELSGLSRERIWQEIQKGLSHRPAAWFHTVVASGHLSEVWPINVESTDSIIAHLRRVQPDDAVIVALTILCLPLAGPAWWTWLQSEPVPRDLLRRLQSLCLAVNHLISGCPLAMRRRICRSADAHVVGRVLTCLQQVPEILDWLAIEADIGPMAPLVTAQDLLAAGIPTGPRIGHLLHEITDKQLRGELSDSEAARRWIESQK